MLSDVDWSNLTVAGAFIAGAVLATFAMIRVVRALTVLFREERRKDREP
jgi:hypothetical protein